MGRPRTDIQPRIVRAARARFLAEGVDGASLRTIAADAGTSVGMVFYYFPIKDDLFLAVVEEVYAGLLDDLRLALSGEAPVRERLKRAFLRLGRASDDELDVVRLVVREALLSSERFRRVLARMRAGHLAMLLSTLQEGIRRGEIDGAVPLPMLLVTTFAMGGVPQFVRRAAGREPPFGALGSFERLADASVELLFRAIGAREPGGAPRKAKKRTRATARQSSAPRR